MTGPQRRLAELRKRLEGRPDDELISIATRYALTVGRLYLGDLDSAASELASQTLGLLGRSIREDMESSTSGLDARWEAYFESERIGAPNFPRTSYLILLHALIKGFEGKLYRDVIIERLSSTIDPEGPVMVPAGPHSYSYVADATYRSSQARANLELLAALVEGRRRR